MNSRTLEKIISYRTHFSCELMKEILRWKIFYQLSLINKKNSISFYEQKFKGVKDNHDLFIIEALAAREYWAGFNKLISGKCEWEGRHPHQDDPVNKLLDVGYHYLVGILLKIFTQLDLPYELGFLHKAQFKSSKPLIYDFMEWIRSLVVDKTLLTFLRKKKKIVKKVSSKDIAIFVNSIKKNISKLYFNRHLGYCITLEFWIRLNTLNLQSGINHHIYPQWNFPSLRYESRCKNKKPQTKMSRVAETN